MRAHELRPGQTPGIRVARAGARQKNPGHTSCRTDFGHYDGGELCFENGTVLSQRDVWHSFNGRDVTHWNNEILPAQDSDEPPLKYAIVAYSHEGNSIMRRRPRPTRWARALKALRRLLGSAVVLVVPELPDDKLIGLLLGF